MSEPAGRLSLEQGSDQIYTLDDDREGRGVTIRVHGLAVRINVGVDGLRANITHHEGGPARDSAFVAWEDEDDDERCDEEADDCCVPGCTKVAMSPNGACESCLTA